MGPIRCRWANSTAFLSFLSASPDSAGCSRRKLRPAHRTIEKMEEGGNGRRRRIWRSVRRSAIELVRTLLSKSGNGSIRDSNRTVGCKRFTVSHERQQRANSPMREAEDAERAKRRWWWSVGGRAGGRNKGGDGQRWAAVRGRVLTGGSLAAVDSSGQQWTHTGPRWAAAGRGSASYLQRRSTLSGHASKWAGLAGFP